MAQPSVEEQQELQALQAQYEQFKQEYQAVQVKIMELNHQREEYDVVLKTLEQVKDPKRKCYRAVGGSLLETDVEGCIPVLKKKSSALTTVIAKYQQELKQAMKSLDEWKAQNAKLQNK